MYRRAFTAMGIASAAAVTYSYYNTSPAASTTLNIKTFTPYTLVYAKVVSSTSTIFTLRSPSAATDHPESTRPWTRGVWSVQIKQPQLQIARSYTPLPPAAHDAATSDIRILVRRTQGEIPRYLHSLPADALVELRGPFDEYALPEEDVQAVVFIAGGTGVAPALQIAHALEERQVRRTAGSDGTTMQILWASRRREDCIGAPISTPPSQASAWRIGLLGGKRPEIVEPATATMSDQPQGEIVRQLEGLRQTDNRTSGCSIDTRYFVDEERSFLERKDVERAIQKVTGADPKPGRRLILVSGPDGFIDYVAGPKMLQQGREAQGPVGGLLGQLNLKGWDVWKL